MRADHAFQDLAVFEERRRGVRDAAGFLQLFAEVCRLFRRPEDFAEAAHALGEALGEDGVAYAEIYVSPEIFTRIGLSAEACLSAVDTAFRARPGGCDCRILLDVVRHWGPESAERVLSLHEKTRFESVVGFGMGGDETSLPAAAFSGVYARARALGLKTSVHAGEWAGPDAILAALDALRPDRVDHGIAAAADPRLCERLAEEKTTLCVAPSGNVAIPCAGCSPRACAWRSRRTIPCSSRRRPPANTVSRASASASRTRSCAFSRKTPGAPPSARSASARRAWRRSRGGGWRILRVHVIRKT